MGKYEDMIEELGNLYGEEKVFDTWMDSSNSNLFVSGYLSNPKMFEKVSQITEVSPQNSVHIGDNLVDDIEGAANANFLSIWVNLKAETLKTGGATPNKIVEHLSEIPEAIISLDQPLQS